MIINKKNLILEILIIISLYILYSISFEFYFGIFILIFSLFRLIYRKFYQIAFKIEWILLFFRTIFLIYFFNRKFLGLNYILYVSYYSLMICSLATIIDSFYYIYKTYKLKKLQNEKLKEFIPKNHELKPDLNLAEFNDAEVIKKRSSKHDMQNLKIEEQKPKIRDFKGLRVKVLTKEQKQEYLKEIKHKKK